MGATTGEEGRARGGGGEQAARVPKPCTASSVCVEGGGGGVGGIGIEVRKGGAWGGSRPCLFVLFRVGERKEGEG